MRGGILITGGLGFIGSHIAKALSNRTDREIFVYDVNAADNKERNVIWLQGDIFDSDKLLKVMCSGEVTDVIHMVGLASVADCQQDPNASYKLNVASVQALLEAMRQSKAERLIFPSTAAIYGATNGPKVNEKSAPRPSTIYGSHKLSAEQLIRQYSKRHSFKPTILRLFNVYGDMDKEQGVISLFLRKAIANEPLIVKGGRQLRDFVLLQDVVKAFTSSIDTTNRGGQTINVGSGVGVSISEIAEMVQQSFPSVQVRRERANQDEYSIYADNSLMKETFQFTPMHPRKKIPEFINQCKESLRQ